MFSMADDRCKINIKSIVFQRSITFFLYRCHFQSVHHGLQVCSVQRYRLNVGKCLDSLASTEVGSIETGLDAKTSVITLSSVLDLTFTFCQTHSECCRFSLYSLVDQTFSQELPPTYLLFPFFCCLQSFQMQSQATINHRPAFRNLFRLFFQIQPHDALHLTNGRSLAVICILRLADQYLRRSIINVGRCILSAWT